MVSSVTKGQTLQESLEREPGRTARRPGAILKGRYQIEEKLGEGGFAITYLALDRSTGQRCVVKELSWKWADDWKTIELFEREAHVLAGLNHPGIPRFIEFFADRGEETRMYLVQEYIGADNLTALVERGRRFTEREVIEIALKATEILEYLHGFTPSIIHRDIKPSNLMLDNSGRLHLVDFGAVRDKVLNDQKSEAAGRTIVGTYGYMPFEQFQGNALPASDIFSLGATLVFVLSRKEPHEIESGGSRLEFESHVSVSSGMVAVLRKMLEPDAANRYASAQDLRGDLEALLAGKPAIAQKTAVSHPRSMVAAVLTTALIVAGVFTYFNLKIERKRINQIQQLEEFQQQEEQGRLPLQAPTTPEMGAPVARGMIRFAGKPITNFTRVQPTFWFRDEDLGREQSAHVSFKDGSFGVYGLPEGHFGMSVIFDAQEMNAWSYPGDFRSWVTFSVEEGHVTEIDVDVQKIIHLIHPQDNAVMLKDWDQECEGKWTVPGNVEFAWEPLGEGIVYDYSVSRVGCPYQTAGTEASGSTKDSSITIQLQPSAPDEYYVFQITGKKDGRPVGMLIAHGANGYGWDYRFRIR